MVQAWRRSFWHRNTACLIEGDRRSPLAMYERGVVDEMAARMATIPSGHRSSEFNAAVPLRRGTMVEAIGQRMAYKAHCILVM